MWVKNDLKPEKQRVYLVFGTMNKGSEFEKRTSYQMFWDGEFWVDIVIREDLNENGKAVEFWFDTSHIASPDSQPSGVSLIEIERNRQIEQLGYDIKHDELYSKNELADAAICYACAPEIRDQDDEETGTSLNVVLWPWDEKYWKPTPNDRKKELVKAGALIAAQIDRINYEESIISKSNKMKITFLVWYELFTEELYKKNYCREIDKEKAKIDWENNLSPEDSAKCFLEEVE